MRIVVDTDCDITKSFAICSQLLNILSLINFDISIKRVQIVAVSLAIHLPK